MYVKDKFERDSCGVLIVEDDRDDAFLISRALNIVAARRNMRIGVSHCLNGFEALNRVNGDEKYRLRPDVVVVDLNMAPVNGDQFLGALREDPHLSEVPAAVLTTSTERWIHAKALACGADIVFSKPNSQEELLEIADQILELGARPAAVN